MLLLIQAVEAVDGARTLLELAGPGGPATRPHWQRARQLLSAAHAELVAAADRQRPSVDAAAWARTSRSTPTPETTE
jgi:hypothetical protein